MADGSGWEDAPVRLHAPRELTIHRPRMGKWNLWATVDRVVIGAGFELVIATADGKTQLFRQGDTRITDTCIVATTVRFAVGARVSCNGWAGKIYAYKGDDTLVLLLGNAQAEIVPNRVIRLWPPRRPWPKPQPPSAEPAAAPAHAAAAAGEAGGAQSSEKTEAPPERDFLPKGDPCPGCAEYPQKAALVPERLMKLPNDLPGRRPPAPKFALHPSVAEEAEVYEVYPGPILWYRPTLADCCVRRAPDGHFCAAMAPGSKYSASPTKRLELLIVPPGAHREPRDWGFEAVQCNAPLHRQPHGYLLMRDHDPKQSGLMPIHYYKPALSVVTSERMEKIWKRVPTMHWPQFGDRHDRCVAVCENDCKWNTADPTYLPVVQKEIADLWCPDWRFMRPGRCKTGPGGGVGVFAAQPLEPGRQVGYYPFYFDSVQHSIYRLSASSSAGDPDSWNDVCPEFALCPSLFLNEPGPGEEANCVMVNHRSTGLSDVVLVSPVNPGKELLMWYGDGYTAHRDYEFSGSRWLLREDWEVKQSRHYLYRHYRNESDAEADRYDKEVHLEWLWGTWTCHRRECFDAPAAETAGAGEGGQAS
eukprot:TRINITY_DN5764_c0_g1_i2.p1 TRINITY_DN5764_c0_g1~~TRINITY_DN5764_c0_g1_i2.p1  ORF type:complete len:626 (+),score=80.12 TRINITY_DN5764_c0_g1_i2:116-1879(+)